MLSYQWSLLNVVIDTIYYSDCSDITKTHQEATITASSMLYDITRMAKSGYNGFGSTSSALAYLQTIEDGVHTVRREIFGDNECSFESKLCFSLTQLYWQVDYVNAVFGGFLKDWQGDHGWRRLDHVHSSTIYHVAFPARRVTHIMRTHID
jgi:hypothetical protein